MSTALVDIRSKLATELARAAKTIPAPSGRTISTKGKLFTMPDGRTNAGPMKAVILDHRNFNRLFAAAYNPQTPTPPKCFALNKELTLAPHPDAPEPQAASCAECALNQWGSAPTGRGKACRNNVRLAIAPVDAKATDEPYIISVAPTGIKHWASFARNLEVNGRLPIQVAAELSFDPNQAYPLVLIKAVEPLADDKLAIMWALREKAQAFLDAPPAGQAD